MAKGYSFTDISKPINCVATPTAGGSLTAGVTYYYRVVATKGSQVSYSWYGKSKASDEFSGTADATNKSMTITFDIPVGEAVSYRIFRATSSGGFLNGYFPPIGYMPTDAACNSGGTVTFVDDGTSGVGNNCYLDLYNDAHGILTLSGSTSSDKFSIVDLYNADVAAGWGVIQKISEHVYLVNTYLVGHSAMYWEDVDKTIIFADALYSNTNYNWQFGTLSGSQLTASGCNLIFSNTWLSNIVWGTLNAYSTNFSYIYASYYSGSYGFIGANYSAGALINCNISKFRNLIPLSGANCSMTKVTMTKFDNAFSSGAGTFTDVNMLGGSRVFQLVGAQSATARGLYTEGSAVVYFISCTQSLTLIDSIFSSILAAGSNDCYLYDKISFNLNVVDESGNPINSANLSIYDVDGTKVVDTNTDSNGDITEQFITREQYHVVGTSKPVDPRGPFTIKISKSGFKTYKEVVSYDASEPIVKTMALQKNKVLNLSNNIQLSE